MVSDSGPSPMRTSFLAIVLVVMTLLAGCSATDLPVSDGGTATPDAGDPMPTTMGSDDDTLPTGTYRAFEFAALGTYTYEVSNPYDGTGTYVFDVQSIERGDRAIALDWRIAGQHHTELVTGDRVAIQDGVLSNSNMELDAQGMLYRTVYEPSAWMLGRQLTVGSEWGQTIDGVAGETAVDGTLTVTGTDVVGGVPCYVIQVVADGGVAYQGCFSPDHGLPMQSVYYDQSGSVALSMTLTSYEAA